MQRPLKEPANQDESEMSDLPGTAILFILFYIQVEGDLKDT
jgi:hypothetical protein